MGRILRWMGIATLCVAASSAFGTDSTSLPGHTVKGNLDARAHLQAVHDEMKRECGASPDSARCQHLKREFRQEARAYQRRHPK